MEVGVITEFSGEQACISVWDLSTGIRLKTYKNCSCGRNGLDFITNNYVICAQHEKQMLHVYDTQNERLVKRIVCPGKISSLAVSPDGNYCVVALLEKIYIWQITTGNLMNVLSKHYQNITCIKFTTDGSFFMTCGDDNLVLIWNFVSALQPRDPFSDTDICEQPMHSLIHHSMPIQDMHVGINGMRCSIVTCSIDQTCKIFDLCTGKVVCTFVFDVGCTSVTMDAAERKLFAGTLDGSIYFVNCHAKGKDQQLHINSQKKNRLKAHNKCVNSLFVMMDGTKLISGSLDCTVKLWHITNRQCLKTFDFKGEISNVCIKLYARTFEHKEETLKLKPSIANFRRSVFVPGDFSHVIKTVDEDETLMPIILRQVDDKSLVDSCVLPKNSFFEDNSSLVNKVMMECISQNTPLNYLQPKTATRLELLQEVMDLEAMTKEIYAFTTDKLLKETSDKTETEIKTE